MGFCFHNLYEVLKVSVTVFSLCYKGYTAAEQCLNSSLAPSTLTCDFHSSFCSWRNAHGGDFKWKLDDPLGESPHISAEEGSSGSKAVLESDLVCSTGDKMIQLQFTYYMGRDPGRCQLTASVQTEFGTSDIVTLTYQDGQKFTDAGTFFIICPETLFKIIFEAKKVKDWCGSLTRGVSIDDVNVQLVPLTQTAFTSCRTDTTYSPAINSSIPLNTNTPGAIFTPEATSEDLLGTSWSSPNITTQDDYNGLPSTPEDGSLGDGAEAGLVISVVLVAVVLVAVVVVLILCRTLHPYKSSASSDNINSPRRGLPEVTNSAYEPDLLFKPALTSGNTVEETETVRTIWPDLPRASASYSTAVLAVEAPTKPRRDEDGYEIAIILKPDTTENTHQGQMIIFPTTSNEGRAQGSKDRKSKGANPKGDGYDALSFEPAKKPDPSSGMVHYDHLHGTEEGPDSYNKLSFGAKASVDSYVGGTDYDHLQD